MSPNHSGLNVGLAQSATSWLQPGTASGNLTATRDWQTGSHSTTVTSNTTPRFFAILRKARDVAEQPSQRESTLRTRCLTGEGLCCGSPPFNCSFNRFMSAALRTAASDHSIGCTRLRFLPTIALFFLGSQADASIDASSQPPTANATKSHLSTRCTWCFDLTHTSHITGLDWCHLRCVNARACFRRRRCHGRFGQFGTTIVAVAPASKIIITAKCTTEIGGTTQ